MASEQSNADPVNTESPTVDPGTMNLKPGTDQQQHEKVTKQTRIKFRCIIHNLEKTGGQDEVLVQLQNLLSDHAAVEVQGVELADGTGHPRLVDSIEATVFISCDGKMAPSQMSWPRWLRNEWSQNLIPKGSILWLEIARGVFDYRYSDGWRNQPSKIELNFRHLTLGAFVSPGKYFCHWDASTEIRPEINNSTKIKTTLEFDTRLLNITARYLQSSEGMEWKLELPFDSIRTRVLVHQRNRDSSADLYFFTNRQPKIYSAKLSRKISESLWNNQSEKEQTFLNSDSDEEEDFSVPFYDLNDDDFENDMFNVSIDTSLRQWNRDTTFYNCEQSCLGQINAIHVQLAMAGNDALYRLERTGFSIVYGNPKWVSKRDMQTSNYLQRPKFECFDDSYALECLLSRGYQVTDQLTEKCYSMILDGLKKKNPEVANILLKLADNIDDGLMMNIEQCLETMLDQISQKTAKELYCVKETALAHFSMVRRLVMTPATTFFLRPELVIQNRVIRHYGPDRFLRVAVRDEDFQKLTPSSGPDSLAKPLDRIRKVLIQGITINNRHYQFLAASNSQLREHGFWMYAPEEVGGVEKARGWMGDLVGERCVATYVSRLGQCFSSTKDTVEVDVQGGMVERISDVGRNSYCFTDGIGKISQPLADKVSNTLGLYPTPSAFQIRYAGCKGVLAMDPTIQTEKICVRESMEKFKSSHSKLEVIEATHPGALFMNRQVITLMCGLGVKEESILSLQEDMLFNLADMLIDEQAAIKALTQARTGISKEMIAGSGLHLTTEHFFRSILLTVYKSQLRELMRRTRILVPPESGRIMMGTVDETATLQYGQVFVQYSTHLYGKPEQRRILEGSVVVTKNPCFHPGDLRRFEAVDVPGLHHMVDCLVFPSRGSRPHPNEISGSDLDGDMYFVCWEPSLIPPEPNKPAMDFTSKKKQILDHAVSGTDIVNFVIEYIRNDQLGMIANAHLVFSDIEKNGIFSEKCIQLAQMHSDAVDFPKTGYCPSLPAEQRPTSYPTFMSKQDKPSYKSNKIIGKLFDQCKALDTTNRMQAGLTEGTSRVRPQHELLLNGFEDYLPQVSELREFYEERVRSIMILYGIETEAEVFTGNLLKFRQKRGALKNEKYEISQLVQARMASLRRQAKSMFYEEFGGAKGPAESAEHRVSMLKKASALYYTCYTPRHEEAFDNEAQLLSLPWIFLPLMVRVSQVNAGLISIDAPLDLKRESSRPTLMVNKPIESNTALRKISHSIIQYFSSIESDAQKALSENRRAADRFQKIFRDRGLNVQLDVSDLSTLGLLHEETNTCLSWRVHDRQRLEQTSFLIQTTLENKGYKTRGAKMRERVPLRATNPNEKDNNKSLIFRPDVETFTGELAIIRKAIDVNPWILPLLQTLLFWAERSKITSLVSGEKLLVYFLGKLDNVTAIRHPGIIVNQEVYAKGLPTFCLESEIKEGQNLAVVIPDSLLGESLMNLLKASIRDLGANSKERNMPGNRPKVAQMMVFSMLQPPDRARIMKRMLQAYHSAATHSSVAELVGIEITEAGQLVKILARDVWGCIMCAEQYTARRMSQTSGAEVSIRQKYFPIEGVIGLVLEAYGDNEALAKVEEAIDALEKKSSMFVTSPSGVFLSKITNARKILFEDCTSIAEYVTFAHYDGPRHQRHDLANIQIPYLKNPSKPEVDEIEVGMDYQMYMSGMLQQISLLQKEYDPQFHGQFRLIVRFGTIYIMNASKTTLVLKDFYDEMNTEWVADRPRGRRGHRGRGRGNARGWNTGLHSTRLMRASFFPKGIEIPEQLHAALKAMEFGQTEEGHFFQASVYDKTKGRRSDSHLLLDNDFNFCELRLPSFKWLTLDVRRAPQNDKKPDVRIALQSRRILNHSDLKDDPQWKGIISQKTQVLTRTWQGLKVHSNANNRVDFVREKRVKEYKYCGMPYGDHLINNTKIRVSDITEYSRLGQDGLFGHVDRNRLELSLEAALPEDLTDENDIRQWAKSAWELAFNLSKCF